MSSEIRVYNDDLFGGHFINNTSEIVSDTLLGMTACNSKLGVFNFGNVAVCRDYAEHNIVKVISGGASGYEPFQAGFVGKGMLCAAVQGDIFRSPFVSTILKTIKEVSNKLTAGVLVIVRNNISDCLNFGLAVERARNQGISVETVIVDDEFCVTNRHQGRRGLSGVILVNKIAGAMAHRLISLKTVSQFCKKVVENTVSSLFSIKACQQADECICMSEQNSYEIEIGTGLHGEKGLSVIDKANAKEVTAFILTQMSNAFPIYSTEPVVVLVNNLGLSLQLEEMLFLKEVLSDLQEGLVSIARVYNGKFLTSPKTRGFSLTILKVFDAELLSYLDDPCEVPGWGYINRDSVINHTPIPCRPTKPNEAAHFGPRLTALQCNAVYYALQFACDALISCERHINVVDSDDGGRNIGTKMKRGATVVLEQMKRKCLDFSYPKCWFDVLSKISERFVGGAIGSFYSILFEVASTYFGELREETHVDFAIWLKCFEEAISIIKRYGNTEFGFGTMYDPLFACVETLNMCPQQNTSMELFRLSLKHVEDAVLRTKQGSRKYVDPGAEVVGIWIKAIYEGLSLRYN